MHASTKGHISIVKELLAVPDIHDINIKDKVRKQLIVDIAIFISDII